MTPGVRLVLALMVVSFLVGLVGTLTSTYTLSTWLALSSPAFWRGQIWLVLTYVVLATSLWELLINGLVIAWLGSRLERLWSRREFWIYCLLVTAGSGLVKVLVQPSAPSPLAGSTPLVLGLLAGWLRVCRQGGFSFRSLLDARVQGAACLLAGVSFFMMLFSVGLADALVMVSGGLIGWLYLSIRRRPHASIAAQPATSERMARLEL